MMSGKRRKLISIPLALLIALTLLTSISPPALFASAIGTTAGDAASSDAAMAVYEGSEGQQTPDVTEQAPATDSPEMVSELPQITDPAPAIITSRLVTMTDTTPPLITSYSPADGSMTGSSLTISASYSDPEPSAGIKPSTAMIHIDNRHQFGTIITDTEITLHKTGLTEGSHKLEAYICDNLYNCTVATWHMTVDATAPVISGSQPTGTVNASSTMIAASFSDGAGTGIDPATASTSLDGTNLNSAACSASSAGISCGSGSLSEGVHEVQIEVTDLAGNRATKNWSFTVDTAAIAVTGQTPDAGSLQTSAMPSIKADFQRAGSGVIDSSSIIVLLDGTDVSADTECSTEGIIYRPSSQLSEGPHTVIITLSDNAGHAGRGEWNFFIDTIAPRIINEIPSGIVSGRPNISAELIENGSGIDSDSLNLTLDGINATSSATVSGNLISYSPPESLAPGPHSVQLAVRDMAGNQQVAAWNFSVPQPPTPVRIPLAPLVTEQLTLVEYWQSYSSLSGAGGNWMISGFVSFPSTYYLPWYDSAQTAGPFRDEVVIKNQGAGSAIVNVLLGGEVKWQGKIDENGSETVQIPDVMGGPLKIICPSGQPLEVIHRVTGATGAISETSAIAETDLESILLLPWYETRPESEGSSSLAIANAGGEEAAVDVYIGDPKKPESLKGHYSIAPNSAARTTLADTSGGPVRIVSTNNQPLLADIQVIRHDDFLETSATGISQLGDRFIYSPSDHNGRQPSSFQIGNGNERDLQVEIRIGDELLRDPDNSDNEYITIPRHDTRAISLMPAPGRTTIEISCRDCLFGEGIVIAESSS